MTATTTLPPESREPVLQFALLKRLAYRTRMTVVAVLVGVGMILQVATLNVLPGVPFLLAAVAVSWVVGFDNKLDRRGLRTDGAWRRVPFERVRSIVSLDADIRRWDQSALDVSSTLGCAVMLVAIAFLCAASVACLAAYGLGAAAIVAVDGAVLLVLQWFSGMRTVDRKPDLVLKAQHLAAVVGAEREAIDAAGTLHAQLLLRGQDAGATPDDARLLVDVKDPPCDLLAVQGQVVLNRVQGTPYPYFYCVVVADAAAGLADFAAPLAPGGDGITIEVKRESDVHVVVVRQTTSKTSGYHTKPDASSRLLEGALQIATRFRDAT